MASEILLYKEKRRYKKEQFVFVGRLDKLKGIDLLLRVWLMLGNSFPRLIICGTGSLEDWCETFIRENNIRNVGLLGFVSNEEVKRIIGESRALILPTQWYEGFPMSIVEAYSEGTPVIGSNIGNVDSLILQGITGLTFEYNNVDSLRKAIYTFLSCEWSGVKRYYGEHFGEESNYDILARIYENLCE